MCSYGKREEGGARGREDTNREMAAREAKVDMSPYITPRCGAACCYLGDHFGGSVISMAQMAAGRMYMEAR